MRCFGYDESGHVVIDSEAHVIRDCVRRMLEGQESIPSILADLRQRGVHTTAGKAWSRHSFVRLMTNPRLAGKLDSPKIIELEEHERLVAWLEAAAKTGHGYGNQLKHLLVGFLVCGGTKKDGEPCGSFLWSQPSNTGRRGYACRGSSPVYGCGRIRVQAEQLEDHLVNQALAELASDPMRRRLEDKLRAMAGDERKVQQAVATLDERLAVAWQEYVHSQLSIDTLKAIERAVKAEQERLLDYQKQLRLLEELPTDSVEKLSVWWEGAPLLRQRELLRLVLEKVIVRPATRRGFMHLDVDRVDARWR